MSRWIVFDQLTADAVQSLWGVRPELHADPAAQANIVKMLLKSSAAVAVGPAGTPGRVLLMRTIHPQQPQTTAAKPTSALAPAGFLGLSDSVDMDTYDEPERPKKWWQKILD